MRMVKFLTYFLSFFPITLVVQNEATNIQFGSKNDDNSSYLDPQISVICPRNGKMFIKGNDLKISEFVRRNGDIYSLCSYSTDLKYINVFALNSIVIDVDVDVSGSHLKLFFIAPTWVVVGNRKIAVDGSKGDYIPKAIDGNDSTIDGQDGKPGLPGGPGGHFLGIGESFLNGKSLTITASGGIGGTGQYGVDGYNQVQGRYVNTNVLGKIWCGLYYDICRGKDKKYQLNLIDNHGNYSDFYCEGLYEKENMARCSYKIFGWNGEVGGKGGNGGRGGKGGLPGSVKVIDLKNYSQIRTYNLLGKYGKDGVGGIGGRSGRNGHNIIYEDVYFLTPPRITFEIEQECDYLFGPSGSDGCNSDGYNDVSEAADVLTHDDILNTINDYKSWLRERVVQQKSSSFNFTFYKHLDENIYIRNMYNTSEFLNEIKSIDEALTQLKSTVDFLPFYESLLERIYFYAKKYKSDKERVEDRKILSLLYTAMLGKIYNLDEHADTYLVIQIPPYLELVKKNLQKVSYLIKGGSKFSRIATEVNELNKYRENYENQVHRLVTKSKQYVDLKLVVNTEALTENESNEISKLVCDIIRFKNRPINNEQELLKWGKRLQDSLIIRSNIYSLRLVNNMFTILTNFAEVVSAVVTARAGVPTVLSLVGNSTSNSTFSSQAFNELRNKTEAIKTKEVVEISQLLTNILNITKIYPDILFDMTEEVLLVYKKLQNDNRFMSVNALRSDLHQAVKIKRDELSTMNLYPYKNINVKAYQHIISARSAFIELNRILKATSLSRGFVDLYDEYKHDNAKRGIIFEYIDRAYNILQTEKNHEDGIYVAVYQLLQRIEDITVAVLDNSDTASTLAFEVMKWNIPLILDHIKQKTQLFKDSYQGKGYVKHIIDNVMGACSAFTGVFERIKNYLQQKQLENHIADTTDGINKGIQFNNVLFAKQYETIKKGFESNLVLLHYKKAVDTFKQYVFPMADFYFKDIILPSHFNISDDVAHTIEVAITQIDIMLGKVEEHKESMLNGDGLMGRKDFGGRKFRSPNPFFVWKNEQYKDIIAELLSGNEVTVNADINKSDIGDDAIKFHYIDFYFTSNNESLQERINYIMGDFEIDAYHLGNSHYRYGDNIYLITSDSLSISYGFEIDEETGRPATVGGAYDYIRNLDISLSPYALWKIKLVPLWEDVSFDSLIIFKDIVDLELGGNGNYMSKGKLDVLDLKVGKYYKPQNKYDA